jgi:hypothetical protein
MRTALMLLALIAAPALAGQTVWKWVDEKGVTHYSDQPVPGAERVEIAVSRTGTVATPRASTPSSSSGANAPQGAVANYRNFEILKPGNQDTIPNSGGTVDVRLRYEPALQVGHAVYLYLDGRLVQDFPPSALEYTLRDVPRGEHSLIAVIHNERGTRIQETEQIRFTVRQESIAQPPVGPALRPPPKPTPRGQQAGNKLPGSQPSYAALNGERPKIDPRTNKPVPVKPPAKP